jgi:hypothetical protein
VRALLEHGAVPTLRNHKGEGPLDRAATRPSEWREPVTAVLREYGAD